MAYFGRLIAFVLVLVGTAQYSQAQWVVRSGGSGRIARPSAVLSIQGGGSGYVPQSGWRHPTYNFYLGVPSYYYYAQPYYVSPPLLFPPRVVSAEGLYGPTAMPGIVTPASGTAPLLPDDDADVNPPVKALRVNDASRDTADHYLQQGDAKMRQGDFSSAVAKYRSARDAAPNYPQAAIREGIGRAAQGFYEAAGWSLRRAIFLNRELKDLDVNLESLLTKSGKDAMLEKLAAGLAAEPENLSICLTLGACLILDGQVEKGGVLLEKYSQLGGNQDHVLDELLQRARQAPMKQTEF